MNIRAFSYLLYFIVLCGFKSNLSAQIDSTLTRIDLLSTTREDSLYQIKTILLKYVPELSNWDKDIRKATNNKVTLCVFLSGSYLTENSDSNYYEIYVGENHPDYTVAIQFFFMDKNMMDVYAYDLPNDKLLTLIEWRRRHLNIVDFK